MMCEGGNGSLRFVGDPIDVVTGAFLEDTKDFQVADPTPIVWRRIYSTGHIANDRGLGIGNSHSFDHRLRIDLDGIRYRAPNGACVDFPIFPSASARVATRGYVLTRLDHQLTVETPERVAFVFEMRTAPDARLVEVRTDRRPVRLGYDAADRLVSLSNDEDSVVTIPWDALHIVSINARRRGDPTPTRVATYRYDADRLVEFEDGYRAVMRYVHDSAGRIVARADRRGYKFGFRYDADGRCVHSAAEDGVLEVRLAYFPLERRTVVTKSDGGVWEYFYDDVGTITTIVDPEGATRSFVPRRSDGQIEKEVDGARNEFTYDYDESGAFVLKLDSMGREVLPSNGHRVPTTAAEFDVGSFPRRPTQLPGPFEIQGMLPSDTIQFLQLSRDGHTGQVHAIHDLQGRLLREYDGRSQRRFAYDAGGNLRWELDFDGSRVEYDVRSLNQLHILTDPAGRATRIEYNTEDREAAVVDAGGTRTEYLRNMRSELVGVVRAGALRDRYLRDGAGRLAAKYGAAGLLYTLTRGAQGEILERKLVDGGYERYAYDDRLRRIAADSVTDAVSLAYDNAGKLIADERNGQGVRRSFGEVDVVELRINNRYVTRYRTIGATRTVTDPTGRAHSFRDLGSGIIVREHSSGRRETTQYDREGRCVTRILDGALGERWVRVFERSVEGYVLARHDSATGTVRYRLDASHRLVSKEASSRLIEHFVHDLGGNVIELGSTKVSVLPGNLLATCGDRGFSHDIRHAVSREDTPTTSRRFYRDARDQLTRVDCFTAPTAASAAGWQCTRWTATYDALNRRTSKSFANAKTRFIWDGDRLAAELTPNGTFRVYVYADDFAMTPFVFVDYPSGGAAPASGDVYFLYSDHQGCPERVEDLSGVVVWAATISPYGLAHVTTGENFHQPLRWPGHYFDAELGLNYNRFRTYSAELGRYLEPDPLGRAGGRDNIYAYTHNPLHIVDVDGNFECPVQRQRKIDRRKKAEKEDEEAFAAELDAMSSKKRAAAAEEADERVQALKKQQAAEEELMAARRQRYLAECAAAGPPPKPVMPYNEWETAALRAQENSSRGQANENAAIKSAGLKNNNNAKPPKTYGEPPNQTRPDAFSKGKAIDVKSVPDTPDPDGGPRKVYNTDQMDRQRKGAVADRDGAKGHAVIISNSDPSNVEPSGPLAEKSTVLHHDPGTDSWSKWTPATDEDPAGWQSISKRTAKRMLSSGPNE